MNLQHFRHILFLFILASITLLACQKQTPKLEIVPENYKNFSISSGLATHIKISGERWVVDYVKLEDTQSDVVDSNGQALRLDGLDTIYAANGWFCMAKSDNGAALFLRLKENFEQTPRTVLIGLDANGQKEELKITQHRASRYRIVGKKIKELTNLRKEYTSDHECSPLQLINGSSEVKSMATEQIFQNVKHSSTFESEDYGAFAWLGSEQDSMLFMEELAVEGGSRWSPPVKYKEGTTQTSYLDENGSRTHFDVDPYRKLQLSGKMTYVERTCEYIFTIQNEDSNDRFDISGVWKQILPIHTTIIIESNTPIVSIAESNNVDHTD